MSMVLVHIWTGVHLRTIAAASSREEAIGRVDKLLRTPEWSRLYGDSSIGECVVLTPIARIGEKVHEDMEVIFTLKEIGGDSGIPSVYVWASAKEMLPPALFSG